MTTTPLLEVKGITKQFGGLLAVDSISFHVNPGEIISIIGPNGAGKTTIFNMLTGVYTIDSGEVLLGGKPIHNLKPQKIVEAGMSRTFQNIRLFPNMRVVENVLIGTHSRTAYSFWDALLRTPRFKREEARVTLKALHLIKSIGLDTQADAYASSLPYGAQRKLEIARAMATDAKIILLDEPAAGMNPQESEELKAFIRSMKELGLTIILIEHDMRVVMDISHRIYVLDHGRKIAEGLPSQISGNKAVTEAYLGIPLNAREVAHA